MQHFLIAISLFVFILIIERIVNYSHSESNRELLNSKKRLARNLFVGTVYRILFIPLIITPVALMIKSNVDISFFHIKNDIIHFIVCLLIYDLTNYATHVLAHKNDYLWRFHAIHHLDNQFDASTGFRQHFMEKIFILPIKITVIMLFAMTPTELAIIGTIEVLNGIFHHSRIPIRRSVERVLSKVFTIPLSMRCIIAIKENIPIQTTVLFLPLGIEFSGL
ncbi:sterol desaturase family protein [Vibrio sp. PP-XX7]